ncbi:MAG: acyl-[Prevotella sp.]|nr:acyl-[acyl-carrier-protein] thioesterase [Prevotella sp.]
MDKLSKTGRYEFLSEPFHCDFGNRLFIGHLGNHLLNAADFHSNDRGFGMHYLNTIHKTWVLSRLAVEMNEMPEAYVRFAVETWVEGVMRFFTNRNFKIEDAKTGKVYGYGRSVWAMIDTETRQPTDLLAVRDGQIVSYIDKDKPCPMEKSGRVKIGESAEFVRSIDTYYNDVDINGHINSIKYIEHIADLWPVDWYRSHAIKRFEAAYVAEAHGGDRLHFYREQTGEGDFSVRIMKQTPDEGEALTEVCRGRVVFTEQ